MGRKSKTNKENMGRKRKRCCSCSPSASSTSDSGSGTGHVNIGLGSNANANGKTLIPILPNFLTLLQSSHRDVDSNNSGNSCSAKSECPAPAPAPAPGEVQLERGNSFNPQLFGGGGGGGGSGGHEPYSHIKPEPVDPSLSFSSMAGLDDLIEEVKTRIIFPIVNKEFVERHGRYPPKGILLHGPPGTGKTRFVQCLAAELSRLTSTKYTFFMRRGSDVMSMWVGESEKNLREIFARAAQSKPAILFFDEIDGLAPNRNKLQSSVPVYANVVTALLAEMDKVKNGDILVICATNRKEAIDPAMKRPGRCDVHIQFAPPNINGRRMIIQLYTKSWGPSAPGEKLLNQIATGTNGFTGADLDKLCSEAFFACVRRSQRSGSGKSSQQQSRYNDVKKVSDNERILLSDWLEALTTMQPSQSNVFGSYIQILHVSDFVQPLIQNSTKELVKRLRPHALSGGGGGGGEAVTVLSRQNNVGGPNCFLAWNSLAKCDDILDALVIPSIMGQLSSMSVFVLNEETMLQEHKQFTINSLIDIVKQAKNHAKPCILFIPRIDHLAKRLGPEVSLLRKLLFDTATKSVLVLATAGSDVGGLPKEVQSMFDGHEKCWKLTKPEEGERRGFFANVFENYGATPPAGGDSSCSDGASDSTNRRNKFGRSNLTGSGSGGGGKQGGSGSGAGSEVTLKSLFEETIKATDHEDMWSMITLHRELANVFTAFNQDSQETETQDADNVKNSNTNPNSILVKQLQEIITAYKEYHLDCSKK